jgi:hypothetical protein
VVVIVIVFYKLNAAKLAYDDGKWLWRPLKSAKLLIKTCLAQQCGGRISIWLLPDTRTI